MLVVETYLRVMNESTSLAVGRQLSSGSIFKTFDNSCLSRTIVSDNQSQRSVELDSLSNSRAEGPNTRDGQFVNSRHDGQLVG